MATIKLEKDQIDEVVLVSSKRNYAAGSKPALEGKTFSSFRYDGVGFIIPSDNTFLEEHANGTVASIKLIKSKRMKQTTDAEVEVTETEVEAIEFDSFTSFKQQENLAKHEFVLNRYKILASQPVSEDMLTALQAG